MRLRPLALPALALAALLAGCGGGDKPSKADYSRNVNRVCAQLEAKTKAATQGSPSSPEEIAGYADRLSKVLDDGATSIENVEVPGGKDGDKAKAYSAELRKEIDDQIKPALAQLKTAAQKRDRAGLQAAAAKIQALDNSKVKKLAREAGATRCAA